MPYITPDPESLAQQYSYIELTAQDFKDAMVEDSRIQRHRREQEREQRMIEQHKARIEADKQHLTEMAVERKRMLDALRSHDGKVETVKGRIKHYRRLIYNAEARINNTEKKIKNRFWAACKNLIQRRLISAGKQLTVGRVRAVEFSIQEPEPPSPPRGIQ